MLVEVSGVVIVVMVVVVAVVAVVVVGVTVVVVVVDDVHVPQATGQASATNFGSSSKPNENM